MFRVPARPDARASSTYVRNIVRLYDSTDHETRGRGAAWYGEAHALARELDGNVTRAAGVIAALSANKSWRDNVNLARAAYRGDHIGHTGDNVRKARAILDGAAPESVLPMTKKTGQFYLCIAWPDHPRAVCVDRHAHDIAVGVALGEADRGLGAAGRYALIADAYRRGARDLGIPPPWLQATDWLAWRASLVGTRGRTRDAISNW